MPKLSYGPAAKARTQQLLRALVDYGNDELWAAEDAAMAEQERFEKALDALRPHLSSHWQSDRALIIRTKIRHLVQLSQLATPDKALSANQIKEALSHLNKFLGILEDNRTSRRGSDTWHFTLHLGVDRRDGDAFDRWFSDCWEQRHPKAKPALPSARAVPQAVEAIAEQASEGIANPASAIATESVDGPDFWQDLSRQDLSRRRHQDLTTNPLTAQAGLSFSTEELYVPVALVRQLGATAKSTASDETAEESDEPIALGQLLQQLSAKPPSRIAIIGEPGAGKTTLLQQTAAWILDHTPDIPLWISLADLDSPSALEDYIFETWLKTALRQRNAPAEQQAELEQQFAQGKVWLLLDAVDEMAMPASLALSQLAKQLNGYLGEVRILMTSRINVWHSGNNALVDFETYQLGGYGQELNASAQNTLAQNISTQPVPMHGQVSSFITRWFQGSDAAAPLLAELFRPDRKRIRDAVRNPLRLALLCRCWSLGQGQLPETKALLYGQFVEAIYDWKQDCFPTTIAQRQQLNQVLGQMALTAMQQPRPLFRLPESLLFQALKVAGVDDFSWIDLALQLGWLTRVSVGAEPTYRFYHATFQEYFAAQQIDGWQDFVEGASIESNQFITRMQTRPHPPTPCPQSWGKGSLKVPHPGLGEGFRERAGEIGNRSNAAAEASAQPTTPIFSTAWREVILLWLGRPDIAQAEKAALMSCLIEFEDDCGGLYAAQAYLLAGLGLAEFAEFEHRDAIADQLLQWRFNRYGHTPKALVQETQRLLSQSDQATVISGFERLLQDPKLYPFKRWMAAYSLAKSYDPGNEVAIATLAELLAQSTDWPVMERIELAKHLGVVDPGNGDAIAALESILTTSDADTQLLRKAALRLGLIDAENAKAISQLLKLLDNNPSPYLEQQVLGDLTKISPQHPRLAAASPAIASAKPTPTVQKRQKTKQSVDRERAITSILNRLETANNLEAKLRLAYRLSQYEPGDPITSQQLWQGLCESQKKSQLRRIAVMVAEVIPEAQLPEMVTKVSELYQHLCDELEATQSPAPVKWERAQACYSILWHCAQTLVYDRFREAWLEI